jgi:hypothetical protein
LVAFILFYDFIKALFLSPSQQHTHTLRAFGLSPWHWMLPTLLREVASFGCGLKLILRDMAHGRSTKELLMEMHISTTVENMSPSRPFARARKGKDALVDVSSHRHDNLLTVANMVMAMRRQEQSYVCGDYLSRAGQEGGHAVLPVPAVVPVDEQCRSRMCLWCYQTVDYFKISRDVVSIAMSFVDRFLDKPQGRSFLFKKRLYQLACVTALFIAIKVHEPVELGLDALVKLGRGLYTIQQIIDTEQAMLLALDWRLNPPLAKDFVTLLVSVFPQDCLSSVIRTSLLEAACKQIDLAVACYGIGTCAATTPSAVAVASLLNAFALLPKTMIISATSYRLFLQYMQQLMGHTHHEETIANLRATLLERMGGPHKLYTKKKVQDQKSLCTGDISDTGMHSQERTFSLATGTISPIAVVMMDTS